MNSEGSPESAAQGEALYSARPWPFLGRPTWTLLSIFLLGLAFTGLPGLELGLLLIVVSLVMLILLWFDAVSQTLTITATRTVLKKELLSDSIREVAHEKVRYIHVKQDALQRILGTGTLLLSSVGPGHIEITCPGIPYPDLAKALIEEHATPSDPGSTQRSGRGPSRSPS